MLTLADGSVFAGRYRILRCIAAGGMGAVYEVIHLETQRRRALKVMLPQFVQSDELRDRFRQEARVAADIESEFIVDVFDAGIDAQTQMPFLVMELLRGQELGKLLQSRGRLTPAEVVTYLHQAALALDKTHRAHIVHRDLKPENLFLTHREDGAPRIKVLDFGIAKVVAEGNTNANATRSLGTPLYMAPEQFRPGHTVSPATDLYALAMVAYTLLVGKAYWAEEAKGCGGNVFAFAVAASQGPREDATVRAQRAGVSLPATLDAWFARAVACSPEARFPSATALVGALAEALGVQRPGVESSAPHGVAALPPRAQAFSVPDATAPGVGATRSPERRRRRGLMIAVGVAVGGAAIGGVALLGRHRVATDGHAIPQSPPTVAASEGGATVPPARVASPPAPVASETSLPSAAIPPEAAPPTSVAAPRGSAPEPPASAQEPVPAARTTAKATSSAATRPARPAPPAQRPAPAASARTGSRGSIHARD
ncbi:protein kinase [Sorangium sp. So ce1036]|uniref:serine/threonine-protein kinase n=1 Tax=Sorangium sp. So ce1036 TaxID=3133328 RepID=UPI003F098194